MTLALDTNVAIGLLRGRIPALRRRFMEVLDSDLDLVVSPIVVHELVYGAQVSAQPGRRRADVDRLLQDFRVEPLTAADVTVAAAIRIRLGRQGLPIGAYDVLIAGQALSRGWTLVTANTREFGRIEGLVLEDWSRP